jgi:hypothetical protein
MFKKKGEITMSRELGNGRWDRVLKARMVELSEADNYDDAKEEWEATGKVWWGGLHHNSYDITTIPEWVSKHPRECLCGHKIVYHYEIRNTKNGIRECVGSDHINSYLILKSISESTGIAIADITDAMIEEWINVRVKGMMAEAWWAEKGDNFTMMFDAVKEIDLRVNVNEKGKYFDPTYQMMRPRTTLRKKGKNGQIASLVWRWNHPDNAKAQINTRGYPNELLEADLVSFYIRLSRNSALVSKEDTMLEKILAAETIRKEIGSGHKKLKVEAMLEYYGLTNFYEFSETETNTWTRSFLRDIELRLGNGRELSTTQLEKLGEVLTPATEKQFNYLRALGYEGTTPLSKRQATTEIDKIKRA